ncbi:MAG: phosphoribosylglycinamide formyltransferase [Pseudomonadota bacterium]|nr:phosphoribosylglycinamide formyltransferase [Pseudomonadota bacterium]
MKTAILISGRGSNMQALVNAASPPEFPARVNLVISNNPDALGLKWAGKVGINTKLINHRDYSNRSAFENELDQSLVGAEVELICLAGFMRLLTQEFVSRWQNRIINMHPSLLPAYKGLNTHQRVINDGVRFTGCTVHFVRPEMDKGPIIAQAVVPVLPNDNAETLASRVLVAEHRCYPFALQMVASGKIKIVNNCVLVENATNPEVVIMNPDDKQS